MVQLREGESMFYRSVCSLFQFQYGAIEGLGSLKRLFAELVFQFQYGAIEGGFSSNVEHILSDFNSSMVQLRDILQALNQHLQVISIPVWCN